MPALERAVDAGATLALAGARRAFGPGGWADAPIERLSPVRSGPGDERERPLAVVVALDASGSMAVPVPGRTTRHRAAVDALAPALGAEAGGDEAGALRPGDLLGLVTFADRPTDVRPLAPLRPGEGRALREELLSERRRPAGGTDIGAGLVRALEALAAGPPDADRVLLLASDAGDTRPGGPDVEAVRRAAAALPGEGRLSALVALVGVTPAEAASVEALVEPLRARGEVRVEVVADAGPALRALVEGELLLRTAARREGTFPLALEPGAPEVALPAAVRAYAPTRARPEATVVARAVDPELEGRRRPPWPTGAAAPAASWPCRSTRRRRRPPWRPSASGPAAAADGHAEARRVGPALELALSGDDLPLALEVTAAAAGGAVARGALTPVTPTTARGRLAAPSSAALLVTVAGPAGVLAATTVPDAAHDELAGDGPDHALLAAVTAAAGGRVLGRLPPPPPPTQAAPWPLAPLAALVALAAVVLDAALTTWGVRRRPAATAITARRAPP
ncbi:MAG: VWA domain-containing protein [Planctomycetes bacterium]|nr:VWA domain-containing protein [Planctomycetota bacterium]